MRNKAMVKTEKPKKKMKIWMKVLIILAVVIVALVIAGRIAISKVMDTVEGGNYAELHQVEVRNLSDSISLSGKVKSAETYNVTSSAAAEIESVSVSVGDVVKEGDVICTLKKEDIEVQIEDLKKQIANADAITQNQYSQNAKALEEAKQDKEAQLNAAQAEINQAQEEYEKALAQYNETLSLLGVKKDEAAAKKAELKKLKKDDEAYAQTKQEYEELAAEESSLSTEEEEEKEYLSGLLKTLDAAKTNYSSVESSANRAIEAAQNTIDMQEYTDGSDSGSVQTQLNELQNQLEDCTVKAKMDGIITAVTVQNGDTNTPGAVIATIEDENNLVMTGSVDEADILKLSEGMEAVITADAIEEKEYKGKVTKVIKVASENASYSAEGEGAAAAGTTYSADISIQDSDLLIGMSVKAKITLHKKDNVLCVPYDLIQYDENENTYVMKAVQNEDGSYTAQKVEVTVGEEINYYTEITGGELEEGDFIVFDTEIQDQDIFNAVMGEEEAGEG